MGAKLVIFYLIPLMIVLIGTAPWVKKNQGLATPFLLLALLPIGNLFAAPFVIIMLIARAFITTPSKS